MPTSFRSLALLPVLWLLMLPTVVQAQYSFVTNNGAIIITGYTGPGGAVAIPDTTNGYPVTSIGDNAFAFSDSLTSVTTGNSLTNIGDLAFYNCSSLTNVTFSTDLLDIGSFAFANCTSLTGIVLPDGVVSIGAGAFDNCINVTSAFISDNVTSIGNGAWYGCTSLASVTIGTGVTNIGEYAFYGCSSLTGACFRGNAPSTGAFVFSGDTNAAAYYLPGTTNWGPMLGDLVTVLWNPPVPYNFTTVNGTITITGYTGAGGEVTIPSTINFLPVTSIGEEAFYACYGLTSVTIPNSVTSIGDNAFFSCNGLASVIIGNSVTSIGGSSFQSCSSLTSVTIPNSVTTIWATAFCDCTSLTNVTIGNGVNRIDFWVFEFCSSLSSVVIPSSVTLLGGDIFELCPSLMSVYFEGNAPITYWPLASYDSQAIAYYLPGTEGWGSSFWGLPAVLWNPTIQTRTSNFGMLSNQFGFNITGTADIPILLEACSNLSSASWTPLLNCTLTNGSVYFSDPQWTNYPQRFYRMRSP